MRRLRWKNGFRVLNHKNQLVFHTIEYGHHFIPSSRDENGFEAKGLSLNNRVLETLTSCYNEGGIQYLLHS